MRRRRVGEHVVHRGQEGLRVGRLQKYLRDAARFGEGFGLSGQIVRGDEDDGCVRRVVGCSEFLREHGMVDVVVHRHKLRETITRLCRLLGAQALPDNLPAAAE